MLTRRRFLAATGVVVAGTLIQRDINLATGPTMNPIWLEAQDWWHGPVGGGEPDFPCTFGQGTCWGRHIHMRVLVPVFDTVSGVVSVDYEVFDHGNTGRWQHIKWQDDTGNAATTIIHKIDRELVGDEVLRGTFQIDTTQENDGNRLWRFYGVLNHPNGNQQVVRPIYSVRVENGKTDKNSADTIRPTGWYKEASGLDWGYVQASIDKSQLPRGPLTSVWKPTFKVTRNDKGGSPPVKEGFVHLDPSFHAGDQGTLLAQRQGPGSMTVTIDPATLAPGAHKLVVRCTQELNGKHHEGVGVYPFTV